MDDQDCPFCSVESGRIAFASTHGDGIWDAFPVSPGHILIVPRRHSPTWNELTDVEKAWAWSAVDQAIALILSRDSPDGFNVGFNLGSAAGQTVSHFHLHVIPRYAGDVHDPRGGVRHVIPSKANYLANRVVTQPGQQSPEPGCGSAVRQSSSIGSAKPTRDGFQTSWMGLLHPHPSKTD